MALATDRVSKLSESYLGLESAKLPGRRHSKSDGNRLEGTGRYLPGLTQLFCFQREGCLRLRYSVHLKTATTQPREK